MFYPLENVYIAIENGPVEIVDLPSYKMVDLPSSLCKRLPFWVFVLRVSSQKPAARWRRPSRAAVAPTAPSARKASRMRKSCHGDADRWIFHHPKWEVTLW